MDIKDKITKILIEDKKNKKQLLAGIYFFRYKDPEEGDIAYIGKDSKMRYKNRLNDHLTSKNRPNKKMMDFDIELQNNIDKYVYEEILYAEPDWLDVIEKIMIKLFKPDFNKKDKKI